MKDQQEALQKAMQELDDVEKSIQGEEESELDALTKSLEDEIGEDPTEADLSKGHKEPDGDEDGEDGDGDGKKEDDDDMNKSDMSDFDDELVKASEAYDELTKSVEGGIGAVMAEMDSMKKSMAALMNLNIKQAKVICELVKSRHEDVSAMAEMAKSVGATPVAPGKAVFGIGSITGEEKIEKSSAEITMALTKAVQEKRVDAHFLGWYGTHKDADGLPTNVRKEIGL